MMGSDRQELLRYPFIMEHKAGMKEELLEKGGLQDIRIGVLCGSTFGVVQDLLELFLLLNGIRPAFWIGSYDRVYEEACFTEPSLAEFRPEIVLVHTSSQDLSCGFSGTGPAALEEEEERHRQIWSGIRRSYGCTVIQNNYAYFPYRIIGNAARASEDGNVRYINELNRFIDGYAGQHDDLYVNDVQYMSAFYGLQNWNDQRMWDLYKYAMSMRVMPAYANNLANLIKAMLGKDKKLFVTDLDDTLWGGTIGEDGAEHVRMGKGSAQGEQYSRLQAYLKAVSRDGILLGICSKNERETALEGIRSKRSLLSEDDFVSSKIDWRAKSENIGEMLSELNLLEDSVVCLDDSPAELSEITSVHPKIETVLSGDVENALRELEVRSYFERIGRTEEDEERSGYYRTEKKRMEERKNYGDYTGYLRSLKMICTVDRICEKNIKRASQLFNKTNQFNFLTVRYTCDELERLCRQEEIRSFVLELDDRFGANGIVSAGLLKMCGGRADIIGWVMSCRVFKRGLESVMLGLMCDRAMSEGKSSLRGYYRQTPKNELLRDFFLERGFHEIGQGRGTAPAAFECSDLAGLKRACSKHQIEVVWKER